ncbi:hypothetical protein G9A89_013446 [Geosiphon pyriformis]|nr:hypothetical protein G9A89_013446 [Geosiphon pyriformis]
MARSLPTRGIYPCFSLQTCDPKLYLRRSGNSHFTRSLNSTPITFSANSKDNERTSSSGFFNTSPLGSREQTGDTNNNKPKSKASSIVRSILHGSVLTKEEERQTHSKLVARGKYVHEFQKHKVKPDCVNDYIQLISRHFPRIANDPANSVHLSGSWQTQIGELDTFIHIWEYYGYKGLQETQKQLENDVNYREFTKQITSMLESRMNQICLEFAFWATSPPVVHNGIYELRTYELKPGRLLEWETNWIKGLECRRQFCEPVGAWFSQLGALNVVHHMWNYPDLETRKTTREQAWEVDGWAETVYKTVRLVDRMETAILIPLPFSPLR